MIVPSGIKAEIAHVITKRTGERALVQFLDSIITGAELWYSGENDLVRVRELMTRYADWPSDILMPLSSRLPRGMAAVY